MFLCGVAEEGSMSKVKEVLMENIGVKVGCKYRQNGKFVLHQKCESGWGGGVREERMMSLMIQKRKKKQ